MIRLPIAALLLLLAIPVLAQERTRPNILVFLVDDLGFMDIGANNPECFYETPNIDRLAKSGMRFTDGYAANPVCSPTRYSLMTGKYPTRVKATNFFSGRRSGKFHPATLADVMPLSEITIAQALRERGYATFFAGKWHLGDREEYFPQKRGFDVNIGGFGAGGPYTGKRYFAPFKNPQIKEESPEGDHLPDRLAREAAAFIKKNKDRPFLTYLSFYSVHTPLMGRPDLVEKYRAKAEAIAGAEFAVEEQVIGDRPRQVRVLQKHAVYAAMVEAMDAAVGKVLKQLEDCGLVDDTIVVFTSDNGGLSTSEGSPTSNLPLRGGKGWVYEGGIREPWIVRYPGVTEAGAVTTQPISSIDLFPTIAAATGVEVEHRIDGIDLTPALKGGSLERDALFWHYPHYSNQGGFPGGAVRMGDFKLVERYEDGRVHLYNLSEDPGEAKDLAAAMPERAGQMRQRLHAWYRSVDAEFLKEKDGNIPWKPDPVAAGADAPGVSRIVSVDETNQLKAQRDEIGEITDLDKLYQDRKHANGLPYHLYVPKDLKPGASYPMVTFLHGYTDLTIDTHKGFPKGVWSLPAIQNAHPHILFVPRNRVKEDKWSSDEYRAMTIEALDDLIAEMNGNAETPNIDVDRLYLTGFSRGGQGTWNFIRSLPEKFAAAAPLSGFSHGPQTAEEAEPIRHIPIWIFNGDGDRGVEGSRISFKALEEAGAEDIRYHEYQSQGHVIDDFAYFTEGFMGWLFGQERRGAPSETSRAAE